MHKNICLSLIMLISSVQANIIQFDASRVRSKENIKLLCDKEGFLVEDTNGITRVESYDTDKLLRNKSLETALKFSKIGKFKVSKLNNGQYRIEAAGELKGGGPVVAWCFYVGTKVGIYGAIAGAAAGSVAAVVATGGAATPAVAAGANAAVGAAGAVVTGLAGAGTAATLGTGAVAGAVAGSASATVAVGTTMGAAVAGGATVGTVETLALAAFAAGMALPTP